VSAELEAVEVAPGRFQKMTKEQAKAFRAKAKEPANKARPPTEDTAEQPDEPEDRDRPKPITSSRAPKRGTK
jgi:hypothetical protein